MAAQLDRTSPHVFYASKCGAVAINPVMPQNGPDSSAALQAVLNLAQTLGPIELVIDLPCLVQQLKLYSYTTVRGLGSFIGDTPVSGLWMGQITNGTNFAVLVNAHPISNYNAGNPAASPTGPANIVDHDISLRDLYIDGQRRNTANALPATPWSNANGQAVVAVAMYGVKRLTVNNVQVYDPCCYHFHLSNIDQAQLNTLYFYDPGYAAAPGTTRFTDGVNLTGPARNVVVRDLRGTPGDDFLAIVAGGSNLCVGIPNQGPPVYGGFPMVYCGTITDVLADGLHPDGGWTVCRIQVAGDPRTSVAQQINNVVVTNVTGSCSAGLESDSPNATQGFNLYVTGCAKQNVLLSNWNFAPAPANANIAGMRLGGIFNNLTFDNVMWGNISANTNPPHVIVQQDSTVTITNLTLRNYSIIEDANGIASPASPLQWTTGTVDEINLVSCRWSRQANTAVAYATISGGTVNRINMTGCSFNHINNAISITGGTVGGITSNGLVHRNANVHPSISLGSVTVPRLRTSGSDTVQLTSGGTITSKKTDATEDS
jgi:hypothetical protein